MVETVKTKFALLLSFLAFPVFCAFSPGQTKPSTKQAQDEEILRFVKKYDDAWNRKDAVVLERVLSPNYVYFGSKGVVRSRQSLMEELLSPNYHLTSGGRSEIKVYTTASTAVVSSRWKGEGTSGVEEFHDDQRCSIVLARGKADWLALSEHCTQIVPPQR